LKIDFRFLEVCDLISTWSKDRSTKVGAVIVGPDGEIRSVGYNGFPRDVDDTIDERLERPLKYKFTEHAERNAVYNAARVGTPLKGCSIYVKWFPCSDCARAIIQAGITTLIAEEEDFDKLKNEKDPKRKAWGEDFEVSKQMLDEAGINIVYKE
jgi:dCMP deaminase